MEEYPPIEIKGGELSAITYKMPMASAQVKSAILLAGLYARGETVVIEPIKTRDHTERILNIFKADVKSKQNKIVVTGKKKLFSPGLITIPGDISSASFFIVLGTLLPNSKILLKNVSFNPSRIGFIRVLKRMGANIKVVDLRTSRCEPAADLYIKSGALKSTAVQKKEIPSLIDELPVLMVAASLARGKSIFNGVGELRLKETDRIRSMSWNLRKMGAKISNLKVKKADNIVIQGVKHLKGSRVRSFDDHRTAMSMIVAGMVAKGKTTIDDINCIKKSFPGFSSLIRSLLT